MRRFAVAVGVATLVAAGPAWADLTKCQQGIEKNGSKLEAAILKAFVKCTDGYRKANGVPATEATAAVSCQTGLNKALDFGNDGLILSAMEKTKASLDKLTTFIPPASPTCTDLDLGRLGHLRTDLFVDRWARLTLLAALKGAYESQASAVGDFPNVLLKLGNLGCALCATLTTPPCTTSFCDVSGSAAETKVLTVPLAVPLDGATITAGCEWQNVLPNEIGFIGAANIGLKPTVVAGSTVCNISFRAEGVYSCAGSTAPKVNMASCQDSLSTDGDECETISFPVCQPDPNGTTGGACASFTPVAGGAGNAFVLSTTRLRISSAVGGDGVACTTDDTYTSTEPAVIPVTTGSAAAEVRDYNDADGLTVTEGPQSGSVGPSCATVRGGSSTGLGLSGAFPGADVSVPVSPLGDTVTRLLLTCN